MATISTGLWGDSNTFNLKEIDSSKVRSELLDFFVDGEEIISAFETIRDQVVFSNKRILVVNVQGITGKKELIFLILIQRSNILVLKLQVFWTLIVSFSLHLMMASLFRLTLKLALI